MGLTEATGKPLSLPPFPADDGVVLGTEASEPVDGGFVPEEDTPPTDTAELLGEILGVVGVVGETVPIEADEATGEGSREGSGVELAKSDSSAFKVLNPSRNRQESNRPH